MRGIVSINLDNMIAIHDIKILQNNDDLFLAMPNRNTKAGGFKDSVHPINAEVREAVERIILVHTDFVWKTTTEMFSLIAYPNLMIHC